MPITEVETIRDVTYDRNTYRLQVDLWSGRTITGVYTRRGIGAILVATGRNASELLTNDEIQTISNALRLERTIVGNNYIRWDGSDARAVFRN
jgi:hypothetical protein